MNLEDVKYLEFNVGDSITFNDVLANEKYEIKELPKITHVLVKASGICGYVEMKFEVGKVKEWGICIGDEVTVWNSYFTVTKLEAVYGDK